MYQYRYLKIATATPVIKIGDPKANAKTIIELAKKLNKAQIILFPELTVTGYTLGDWLFNSELLASHQEALTYLLKESTNQVWILGSVLEYNGSLYNVAYVIYNHQILGIVPKSYLPRSREFYEPRYFATISKEANDFQMIEVLGQMVPFGKILFKSIDNEVTFGVEVCADLWTNVSPHNDLFTSGAEIVFNPSASTFNLGKKHSRLGLCQSASYKGQGAYVYTSNGITETSSDVIFSGHQIVCQVGDILVDSEELAFTDTYHYADIDLEKIKFKRNSTGYLHDFSTGNFKIVNFNLEKSSDFELIQLPSRTPFIVSFDDLEDIITVTTAALYKRLTHIGTKKSVIGVSGGLDSTLALLFCVECYKKYNLPLTDIIGVTMPGLATSQKSKSLAVNLMDKLGISSVNISIEEEVLHHLNLIDHNGTTKDITYENAQARYRTLILMNLANKEKGIVIGTSDMSEIALGWSTFNGDQMAMYALNSGLPKTTVRQLVKYFINKYPNLNAELTEVVNAIISPELTDQTQSTESTLGSYEINDFILHGLFMEGMSKKRLIFLLKKVFNLNENDAITYYERFMKRFKANQFKRLASPEGIKIFELSLSPRGDFRFPGDMK